MAETARQKRITGRVMHEFKHGELKSGRGGKGGKVKSRRQAIAIALNEAGDSRTESARRNKRNLRRTERKEARGRTGQQEREGKSHLGAAGKRESTRAMGGKNAEKRTARGRKAAALMAPPKDPTQPPIPPDSPPSEEPTGIPQPGPDSVPTPDEPLQVPPGTPPEVPQENPTL